jgi:hypothetical protein
MSGNMPYLIFWAWFILLNMMIFSSVHNDMTSLFFMAEYSIIYKIYVMWYTYIYTYIYNVHVYHIFLSIH